jgi:hypothetical protein
MKWYTNDDIPNPKKIAGTIGTKHPLAVKSTVEIVPPKRLDTVADAKNLSKTERLGVVLSKS